MSRLLSATPVTAVDPVAPLHRFQSDGDDAPARLVPGARVFMDVIEPLVGGGVRARVVNGSAEYRLPFDARPGARLHVLVAGTEASPGFVLLTDEADTGASLSRTARLLAALAPGGDQAARPPVVRAPAPLLPAPTADVPVLARALADALARTGLFYEAHQAQWVSGARDREALLKEPQARLTLREVSAERAADVLRGGDGFDARQPGAALEGLVHKDTIALVQQQLAALETGSVIWRGEAWHGRPLEWTVQRETDARRGHGAAHWYTRVRLALPQLGTVDAIIAIDAGGMDVRIAAANPGAADALRSASAGLSSAMAAAGLNVRRLEVLHGP